MLTRSAEMRTKSGTFYRALGSSKLASPVLLAGRKGMEKNGRASSKKSSPTPAGLSSSTKRVPNTLLELGCLTLVSSVSHVQRQGQNSAPWRWGRAVPTLFLCVPGPADQGRSLGVQPTTKRVFEEELLEITALTQTVKPPTEGHHTHLS